MLYIVSGNNNEYRDWVHGQKTIHVSDTRYVSNADQLMGMSTIEGLFIGTCYDRPDISQIVNRINMIRSRTVKPMIELKSLSHLTRYQTTDHSFLNTTTSWSQHNIPVANVTATTYNSTMSGISYNTMSGTSYNTMIADEYTITSSFKVPLSTNTTASEGMSILKVAKTYKSYITNTHNARDNTIEHFFNDKDDAVHFAKRYNSTAYEYI